jgi:DNA-binding NarL/FixJ family response regulator
MASALRVVLSSKPMDKIRITLIEDHDLTRMGLRAAFQQQPDMDFVGEANTGQKGLNLLKSTQPDVALVDIGLPDIDDIEVVQSYQMFQSQLEESPTKVLMLTMYDSEDAVMAAFAAGADSYCLKQTELDVLVSAVRDTHRGHSWIDPVIASIVLRQMQYRAADAAEMEYTIAIKAVDAEYERILENCPLTARELDVLKLIVAGNSNAEIAGKCFITVGTVKTHVRSILNKLGVDDRTKAAVRALRAGLVN